LRILARNQLSHKSRHTLEAISPNFRIKLELKTIYHIIRDYVTSALLSNKGIEILQRANGVLSIFYLFCFPHASSMSPLVTRTSPSLSLTSHSHLSLSRTKEKEGNKNQNKRNEKRLQVKMLSPLATSKQFPKVFTCISLHHSILMHMQSLISPSGTR
jgi:hypothetical protein